MFEHAKFGALTALALCVMVDAQALPERAAADRQQSLERFRAAAGEALVHHSSSLSASALVRAPVGRTLFADGGAGTPEQRARLFLDLHGALFGDPDLERQVTLRSVSRDIAGRTHVQFEQHRESVPVFAARLIVHLDDQGITGINGVFVPDASRVAVDRPLTVARLRDVARIHSAKHHPGHALRVGAGSWTIYPIGLLQGRFVGSRMAYQVTVASERGDVRDHVFVDARTGAVLNRISQVHSVLNREIYTPEQQTAAGTPIPPTYTEGSLGAPADVPLINDPGHGSTAASDYPSNPPLDNLYIFAGGTYKLYDNMFGRKGYDACDNGGPCQPDVKAPAWSPTRGDDYVGQLQKSVLLTNENCPNAYWNGDSTNYCAGFDVDDVVSHEWSHAYTQFMHGLIYQYQSGALNESYSDIFGETYDLVNNLEGPLGGLTLSEHEYYEDGGSRWVVGEDLSEEAAALLLRDMWKPDDFGLGNPGKATSENYSCGADDNGGVHYNSSVPNHAFAMLVDGTAGQGAAGSPAAERNAYNGQTFTGLGLVKAAQIYFHASNNYHTPTTDFPQHAAALEASCQDLKGVTGLRGPTGAPSGQVITQADCDTLHKAMLATEMFLSTPCPFLPVLQPNAPAACDGAANVFVEDWESGDDGWAKTSTGEFTEWNDGTRSLRDFTLDATLPAGRPGTAALARNIPLGQAGGGDCSPGTGDYSGQFTYDSPAIVIPAGANDLHVRFDHYVATEAGFDGGQLEVSVNGGAYALVPQDKYAFNAPSTSFDAPPPIGLNTNPNAGEAAWNGVDVNAPSGSPPGSWGTTIVDLAGIAAPGNTVKLRLTYSQDGCNGVDGWYVDNVRVYSCPALDAPVLTLGADYENPDSDGTYTLNWTQPAGASGPDLLQETQISCGPVLEDDAENGLGMWTAATDDPDFGPVWTESTSKPKPLHPGTTFWASANSEVVFGTSTLTYKNAINLPAGAGASLQFSEWYMNEPEDKGSVEVSVDNGVTWVEVYSTARALESDAAAEAYAADALAVRTIDLSTYAGQSLRLRFKMFVGDSEFFLYNQYGWYVDDIRLSVDKWDNLVTSGRSHTLSGRTGTHCYRVRTSYLVGGQPIASRFSAIVPAVVNINLPPVANAGPDAQVIEGADRTLDGSGSNDPDGETLSFSWSQLAGPSATMTGANTASPSIRAPSVCTNSLLDFRLTVTTPTGSSTDDVRVTVVNNNTPPVASAGNDFAVEEASGVMLSAAGTVDPDCEPLTYAWSQVAGPAVTLTNSSTANPSFTAPTVGSDAVLTFEVTVTDPAGEESTDQINVLVADTLANTPGVIGNSQVGAMPPLALLMLGLACIRRRRPEHPNA
ncbi:MAG TPA: M4 family metallopeptidase [Verrucomicrobiae bacterium]|nr:M4 family metallopeptidase [Verrucomicrobiae bacterium]